MSIKNLRERVSCSITSTLKCTHRFTISFYPFRNLINIKKIITQTFP